MAFNTNKKKVKLFDNNLQHTIRIEEAMKKSKVDNPLEKQLERFKSNLIQNKSNYKQT